MRPPSPGARRPARHPSRGSSCVTERAVTTTSRIRRSPAVPPAVSSAVSAEVSGAVSGAAGNVPSSHAPGTVRPAPCHGQSAPGRLPARSRPAPGRPDGADPRPWPTGPPAPTMETMRGRAAPPPPGTAPVAGFDRTFEALVFDWDGTVVPDRRADAGRSRPRIEALSAAGVHVVIVTRHQRRQRRRPAPRPAAGAGPPPPLLQPRVGGLRRHRPTAPARQPPRPPPRPRTGPRPAGGGHGRPAWPAAVSRPRWSPSASTGARSTSSPSPSGPIPPRRDMDRLARGGRRPACRRPASPASPRWSSWPRRRHGEAGLADPRITSDVKHVEIGLTDKSDSARWAAAWLAGPRASPATSS